MKVFSRANYSLAYSCNLSLQLIAVHSAKNIPSGSLSSNLDQETIWQFTDLRHLEPLKTILQR